MLFFIIAAEGLFFALFFAVFLLGAALFFAVFLLVALLAVFLALVFLAFFFAFFFAMVFLLVVIMSSNCLRELHFSQFECQTLINFFKLTFALLNFLFNTKRKKISQFFFHPDSRVIHI